MPLSPVRTSEPVQKSLTETITGENLLAEAVSNLPASLKIPKLPAVMNTGSTAKGDTMLPLTYSVQDELAKCHGSHKEALETRHRARLPSTPVNGTGRVFERILTISDTHPSSGVDPETGRFDALDDFPPEQQRQLSAWLAREWVTATKTQEPSWVRDNVVSFLSNNATRNTGGEKPIETMRNLRDAEKSHTLRLLLLGDILDFLQIPRPTPGFSFPDGMAPHGRAPKNTPANALVQLNIMHAGHRDYFKTMAIHLFLGNDVDYVPGNHDRPMLHPLVWGGEMEIDGRTLYGFTGLIALELRALGANEDEVKDCLGRLNMLPMVFKDDTVFEHGDQNDSHNKTRRPLKELVDPTPIHEEMDMALGDYGVRDGFNDLERARPSLDGIDSAFRFFSKAAAVPTYAVRMVGSFILGVGQEGYKVSPLDDQKVREDDIAIMVKLSPKMLEAANEIRPPDQQLTQEQLIEGLQKIEQVSARPFFSNFKRGTSFLRRMATMALRGLIGDVDIRNKTTARRDRIEAYHRFLGFNNYVDGHTHVAKNDTYLTEDEQVVRHLNTHTWTDKSGDWNEDGNRWGEDSRGVGVMERGIDGKGERFSELQLMRVIDEDGALVQGELIEQYETQESKIRKRAREIYEAAGSTLQHGVQESLRLAPTESQFLEDAHAPGKSK